MRKGKVIFMFSVGQKVLYGSNGVCSVEGITVRHIGKNDIEYYVLKPICSGTSTLFVPTANRTLCEKIREVLSAEQIRSALGENAGDGEWIENKNLRNEHFKAVISRGDFGELIAMIRQIHAHGEEVSAHGKRLHASDERFLHEAEKMVCDEISLGLSIDRAEVLGLVLQ